MKLSSVTYYFKAIVSVKSMKLIVHHFKWFVEDYLVPHSRLVTGDSAYVHPSVNLKCAENIVIGSHTRIQPGVCLWASPNSKIIIGDYSGIGPGTKIFSSNHKYEKGTLYIKQPWVEKDITIGKNVWVGSNCTILSGVTIGEGSVVAAGSVVTKDIPENSLYGGVPAKKIS